MAKKWDIFCHHDTNKIKYIINLLNIKKGSNILDTLSIEYYDFIIGYLVSPHFFNKQLAIKTIVKYLHKDGKFIICHKEINNLHKNVSPAVVEDKLPK